MEKYLFAPPVCQFCQRQFSGILACECCSLIDSVLWPTEIVFFVFAIQHTGLVTVFPLTMPLPQHRRKINKNSWRHCTNEILQISVDPFWQVTDQVCSLKITYCHLEKLGVARWRHKMEPKFFTLFSSVNFGRFFSGWRQMDSVCVWPTGYNFVCMSHSLEKYY